jgi:predicted CoA-binding protein
MGLGSGAVGLVCDIGLNTKLTPDQRAKYQDTRVIRSILGSAKVVAMVGLSTEPTKPSNMVASYLQDEGYRVIPVHPKAESILGEKAYRSLTEIPFSVDVVDIFRPANEVAGIVEEAIAIGAKAVWCQLRIVDFEAADTALAAGLSVVLDKCMKMEHGRFGGALHWAGMNTEVISARRLR